MPETSLRAGLFAFAWVLACGPVCARPWDEEPVDKLRPSFEYVKFSFKPWLSSGGGKWDTSFPLSPPIPKTDLGFGSTLDFQGSDTLIYLVGAEVRPIPWVSADIQYGSTRFKGGSVFDHDWLNGPNYIVTALPSRNVYANPDHVDMSLSRSDMSGDIQYLCTNLYARVFSSEAKPEQDIRHFFDLLVGYSWYDDLFRIRNGVQLISTGDFIATPPVGTRFNGQDSSFHFHWEGLRLGAREDVSLFRHFNVIGSFAYLPNVMYRGAGFWNLRTDFRSSQPNYIQAAGGTGQEFAFSLEWSPWRAISLESGYMWLRYRASKGSITTYLANGTIASQDLDSAETDRRGFFASVSLKY